MADYDLVIRGGTVVDGSGSSPFKADVALIADRIVAIGDSLGRGHQEIDATGRFVTPGFVDIHTHYDGQVTWEQRLLPSSDHGVTTVVTGNCGVGFAPCRLGDREKLVKVMEGVEDVPEIVMTEGLPWNWESFPEYLDTLDARCFDINVGIQVAHSPLRVYVMGERGVDKEPSTESDQAQMAQLVTEAVQAGAIGVSTSRNLNHRAKNGVPAPSVRTEEEEVLALARGLGAANAGVFQIITETIYAAGAEANLVRKIAEVSKRPVSFSLAQMLERPDVWRELIAGMEEANAAGCRVRAQVLPRPVGVMLGLELSLNPIITRPSYKAIADRPLAERVAILKDPAFKARVLAEEPIADPQPFVNVMISMVYEMSALGERPNYAPRLDERIGHRAAALGVTPLSLAYDLMLEQDGQSILYLPTSNYAAGNLDVVREMMVHPSTVMGLGDGGAHYGLICDAGFPSYLLSYWVRDAEPERRFPIEWAIAELTRRPAETVGLDDRGLIAVGCKADINVIDLDHIVLHAPKVVRDLPAGGRRLRQRVDGYDATIVNGVIVYRHGEATGELPGRLIRGAGYTQAAH